MCDRSKQQVNVRGKTCLLLFVCYGIRTQKTQEWLNLVFIANTYTTIFQNSNLFLFVLDPATVNATSFLEIAHFAVRKAPKLVVVFLRQSEWKERAHPEDLPDRQRTCDLLDDILTMHDVPVLQSVQVFLFSWRK